jgi:hypothetical protein
VLFVGGGDTRDAHRCGCVWRVRGGGGRQCEVRGVTGSCGCCTGGSRGGQTGACAPAFSNNMARTAQLTCIIYDTNYIGLYSLGPVSTPADWWHACMPTSPASLTPPDCALLLATPAYL